MEIPKIIYEDSNFFVINKPSGLIVHQKNIDDDQPSLVDWVIGKYPELKDVGEPFVASGKEVPRAGIVHRLDKETSGLIVVAKDNESFLYLKKLFQDRKIKKYYQALVIGKPKFPHSTINAPLGRIGLKRTTRIKGDKKLIDQKEALTEYKTLKNYTNYTLLEVAPKTGRTHQIRVHLKSIGTPVAGDTVYGFARSKDPKNLERLFLHAYKLELATPDGKALTVESDLPKDLQNVINALE